jgi:hypothetical protein
MCLVVARRRKKSSSVSFNLSFISLKVQQFPIVNPLIPENKDASGWTALTVRCLFDMAMHVL